ncbi:MAG TPA: hypothetical protein VKQ29_05715 [Aliidongia sp.]|nr:hypothetical protein [Aliidongia sp.]
MTETGLSLLDRLWRYQAERFPVWRNGALIAVFSASGISLSSVLGGRPLPGPTAFLVAFGVAFGLFFQLRAADEVKDAEDDRRYRPERPVPRGLVSLRLLVGLAALAAVLQAAAAYLFAPGLLILLAVIWLWMGLMAVEFFVPAYLRARPVLYLVSHMLVMPLVDLWITAVDWLPRAGTPPAGLAPALLLSFANGCVLEIGRKTWAPEAERPGVESYSALWGTGPAARRWSVALAAAAVLVVVTGAAAAAISVMVVIAAVAFGLAALQARAFLVAPTLASQRRLDQAAGLWVLASYASLGAVPLIIRALP